jgi:predicted type IV restriction endonuclease
MATSSTTQPISSLSLRDLKDRLGLGRDRSDPFFREWLAQVELLSDYEQQVLARLQRNYENIIETNPLEEVVKLVVIAPLLDLAGFYQPPFSIRTEVATKLMANDGAQVFTGSIDILVVQQRFWVLVIESKQSRFDVTSGIPQALSYMLAQPSGLGDGGGDRFGMVTNGREVIFLKLNCEQTQEKTNQTPIYCQSRVYQVIETEDDLPQILQGLKVIGQRL